MSSNTGGVNQSIQGSTNTGAMQAGVAGGNANVIQGNSNTVQQSNQIGVEEQISQDEALALLVEMAELLKTANLPEDLKEEISAYLAVSKVAAKKPEPNKENVKENLKQLSETIKATSETVVASKGLWEGLKPILVKLAPWLGVAASFFVGGF